MPRSEITTLLPRPRSVSGRPRDAREADQRPQLEGVVRGREQVGRAPDAHRRELRAAGRAAPPSRPTRRAMSPASAIRSSGAGDGVASRGGSRGRCTASRGHVAVAGQRPPLGEREEDLGDRVGRPGRACDRAAAAIAACRAGSSRSATASSEGVGIERLVRDEPRRAGVHEGLGVRALVRAGVRVRHDDERQPEGGRPRRAWTSPARPTTRSAAASASSSSLAQERLGPVAGPQLLGESVPARPRRRDALRPGHVDDDARARRAAAAPPATASLSRRTACEPPKITHEPRVRRDARDARARRARSTAATSRIGVPVT